MSIAFDRLSPAERQAIAESLLTEPKPYRADELGAHCPFHVEQTAGGAFFYNFEIDAAICHSCGENSDLVGIFNAVHGRPADDPEGCAEFVKKYCAQDGYTPSFRLERKPKPHREWKPGGIDMPPDLWMERAAAFVEHSVDRLQKQPERLAELAAWGIDAETARVCRFGWNDRDKWPPLTAWGLPHEKNDKGKEKKIWLPAGLVMPAIREGRVLKIKIRRPNPLTPWGEDRKYWEVKGGANRLYHVYGASSCRVWVVTETERDAALVWSKCRDLGVGAMGNGGAGKRPAGFVADLLGRARVILNAMDFDHAGASNTYAFWEREYPTSIRYPAPPSMGKDVGEALESGLDVRQWVLDGVPGFIRRDLLPSAQAQESVPTHGSGSAAQPCSYFDQVMERMDRWPLWREELVDFTEWVRLEKLRLFRRPSGELWLTTDNPDRLRDPDDREMLDDIRRCFHERRILDAELGLTSLYDIVERFFGSKLEVRG